MIAMQLDVIKAMNSIVLCFLGMSHNKDWVEEKVYQ